MRPKTRLIDQMGYPTGGSIQWDDSMDELVRRAQEGNEQAFTEVYKVLYPRVAKYLWFKVRSRPLAEELANETFLSAYRGLSKFKHGYFPGWIFTIARNTAAGHLRKKALSTVPIEEGNISAQLGVQQGPEEEVEASIRKENILNCVRQLRGEQREVVIMKYLTGMSNADVAAALGKSENAVNAQQHRALKSLQKLLIAKGVVGA